MANKKLKSFDLVDKHCYEADYFNAPYERIQAETAGKAKSEYLKRHPDSKFIDILCRKSKKYSYDVGRY